MAQPRQKAASSACRTAGKSACAPPAAHRTETFVRTADTCNQIPSSRGATVRPIDFLNECPSKVARKEKLVNEMLEEQTNAAIERITSLSQPDWEKKCAANSRIALPNLPGLLILSSKGEG